MMDVSQLDTSQVINKTNIDFWSSAWEDNNTPWHKESVHPALLANWDALFPPSEDIKNDKRVVLFPLCGQTVDMIYSSKEKGVKTIGIEGVESAITDFYNKNQLSPFKKTAVEHASQPGGDQISTPVFNFTKELEDKKMDLTILEQNFFLTGELPTHPDIGQVQGIFDRGSFVAIEPSLRVNYVKTIMKWLSPSGRILLNVPFYDQTLVKGPPFSVSPSQIEELYSSYGSIELIGTSQGLVHGVASADQNSFLFIKDNN